MRSGGSNGDRVEVVTHGCRLNAAESATIEAHAEAAGRKGLIVHNGCSVTNEAVRSLRRAVRRSRREHPEARIVVTGCAAHTDGDTFRAMNEVDAVIGNAAKLDPATWRSLLTPNTEPLRVDDPYRVIEDAPHMAPHDMVPHVAAGRHGRSRAFLAVQNGCDHACTFCSIPQGRGASRSVPVGVAVEEAKRIAEDGVPEIVLTGVDLTSWGHDLPGTPRLGDLVQAILRHAPDLPRLRLSSIDSVEADPALFDALEDERLMPHLHLSLQHGHDLILKRMRRRHGRDEAIAICAELRRRRPDIVLGADLIAGFPTETAEHHAASLSLIEACGLTHLHVFPFSPRRNTPAARMPPVASEAIKARARELRERGRLSLGRHLRSRVGTRDVIVVHHGRDGRGRLTGLARDFSTIALEWVTPERVAREHEGGSPPAPGALLPVRIMRVEGSTLLATPA